jgi:CRP-like cAMP-binding protein
MDAISDKTNIKSLCESCTHQKLFVFRHLTTEQLKSLSQKMLEINYAPGDVIFKQGGAPQGFFCLKKGKVKIIRSAPNGNEIIIDLKSSPDTLGIRALSTQSRYKSSAVALDPVTVCLIKEKGFQDLLYSCPKMFKELLSYIGDRLVKADQKLISLTQKHVKSRLADTLLLLQQNLGDDTVGYIDISLKRSELAQLSNMTTANVIRTLAEFKCKGIIQFKGRKIKIIDKNALNTISNFE